MFDKRYQVKKFVGEINGTYCRFRVYSTGQIGWILLRPMDRFGCEGGLEFAKKRSDFLRGVLPKGVY